MKVDLSRMKVGCWRKVQCSEVALAYSGGWESLALFQMRSVRVTLAEVAGMDSVATLAM